MKNSTAFISLLVAVFFTGCATPHNHSPLASLREDGGQTLPDATWRAFQAAGYKNNRLVLFNNAPLNSIARAEFGQVAVMMATNIAEIRAQQPLSGGKAAKRGAKLWLGWEEAERAQRLPLGQPRYSGPYESTTSYTWWKGLGSSSGEGAMVLAIGYLLYMPVGATAGAISGAVSAPGEFEVQQAMGVLSNAVVRINANRLLADSVLKQLQQSDRGLAAQPELITTGERPAAVSTLEIRLDSIRLEGGVMTNPKLWLTLEWSAQLRRADAPQPEYALGGVWQSDEMRTLQKWAGDDGAPLRSVLEDGCRQIGAVVVEQIVLGTMTQEASLPESARQIVLDAMSTPNLRAEPIFATALELADSAEHRTCFRRMCGAKSYC